MEAADPAVPLYAKLKTGFLSVNLPSGEKVKFPIDYADKDIAWLIDCIKDEDPGVQTVKFTDSEKYRYCTKTRLSQVFNSTVSLQINDSTSPVVYQDTTPVSMAKVTNNVLSQSEPLSKRSRPSDSRSRGPGDGRSDGRGDAKPSTSGLQSGQRQPHTMNVCHATHVDNQGMELKVENTLFYVRYSDSIGEFSERLAEDVGPVNVYRESDGAAFSKRNTIGEVLLHYSVKLKLMKADQQLRIVCDDIMEGLQNWMVTERGANSSSGATTAGGLSRTIKTPSIDDSLHMQIVKDMDTEGSYLVDDYYLNTDSSTPAGGAMNTIKRGSEHLEAVEIREGERKYARVDKVEDFIDLMESIHGMLQTQEAKSINQALVSVRKDRKTVDRFKYLYYLYKCNYPLFKQLEQSWMHSGKQGGLYKLSLNCAIHVDKEVLIRKEMAGELTVVGRHHFDDIVFSDPKPDMASPASL